MSRPQESQNKPKLDDTTVLSDEERIELVANLVLDMLVEEGLWATD